MSMSIKPEVLVVCCLGAFMSELTHFQVGKAAAIILEHIVFYTSSTVKKKKKQSCIKCERTLLSKIWKHLSCWPISRRLNDKPRSALWHLPPSDRKTKKEKHGVGVWLYTHKFVLKRNVLILDWSSSKSGVRGRIKLSLIRARPKECCLAIINNVENEFCSNQHESLP